MNNTQCLKPLIRAETEDSYINQKGGTSYKYEIIPRDIYDRQKENHKFLTKYRRVTPIACGQCINCLMNTAAEKATKMMMMKPYYPDTECWFLTLTYKDEMLPFHETVNIDTGETMTGASLRKNDLQKFFKKIRRAGYNIKYVSAGEYGGQTGRPHYHVIVFGLPIPPESMKKIGQNWLGQSYWQSDWLDAFWVDENEKGSRKKPIQRGHIEIGEVTWKSCSYVARYVIKKANNINAEWYMMQGLVPEYITWSNGFGDKYFEEHLETIKQTDTIYLPAGEMKTPRKFMEYLKELDETLYDQIKKKRTLAAKANQASLKTDLNKEQYRRMQERKKQSEFKDIRRI